MAVVLIPPFMALLTATIEVRQLAANGEQTVRVAVETVDRSHAMVEHLTAMERFARQRPILGDDKLETRLQGHRAELLQAMTALKALPLSPALHDQLGQIEEAEAGLHDALRADPQSEAYGQAVVGFVPLSEEVRDLRREASDEMVRAAKLLQEHAGGLQQRLVQEALVVLPLILAALGLVWFGAVRPTRALDRAIRELGDGRFENEVHIRGPADLRRLGDRLEWLRTQLLAVESDRVRLFHHISHELKTPLSCIREGSLLLADGVPGPITPDQAEIIGILSTNAEHLHQQIEDLLRISELRTQGTKLELGDVDLREVVRQVVEQNAVAARSANIDFNVDMASIHVRGDALKLRIVVGNLVSNALKHGPPGLPVQIVAREYDDRIELSVADEGRGIPASERESVFEAFRQGQTAWIAAKRGTGLGLTIAREYMRAHGGDLVVGDRPRGTIVIASLPKEVHT